MNSLKWNQINENTYRYIGQGVVITVRKFLQIGVSSEEIYTYTIIGPAVTWGYRKSLKLAMLAAQQIVLAQYTQAEFLPVPKRKKDWKGLIVINLHPVKNGWGSMPAGTQWRVVYTGVCMGLESKPCSDCNLRFSAAIKALGNFRILPSPENKARLQWNRGLKKSKLGIETTPLGVMPEPDFISAEILANPTG